jgi:hypothetical protein
LGCRWALYILHQAYISALRIGFHQLEEMRQVSVHPDFLFISTVKKYQAILETWKQAKNRGPTAWTRARNTSINPIPVRYRFQFVSHTLPQFALCLMATSFLNNRSRGMHQVKVPSQSPRVDTGPMPHVHALGATPHNEREVQPIPPEFNSARTCWCHCGG